MKSEVLRSRSRFRDPARDPRPDILLTLCVLSLTEIRIVIGESDAVRTTDIERREMMFACPRCLEREARELERQGLGLGDIAATLNVTLRAVVLLLEANETTR